MAKENPVFCAVDTADLAEAEHVARAVGPHVGGLKLGLQFFLAHGAEGYRRLAAHGLPIFLDVKLHDIPNTVASAVTSLLPLRPAFITIHAAGGPEMMRAAMKAALQAGETRPKILAVTVLTSLNGADLEMVGQENNPARQVRRLAKLAQECAIDGVVCAPEEIELLRNELGKDLILMVPGIRPLWAEANDQKRVKTPREAIISGASYLVIGRPITRAADPAQAARRITDEL